MALTTEQQWAQDYQKLLLNKQDAASVARNPR